MVKERKECHKIIHFERKIDKERGRGEKEEGMGQEEDIFLGFGIEGDVDVEPIADFHREGPRIYTKRIRKDILKVKGMEIKKEETIMKRK